MKRIVRYVKIFKIVQPFFPIITEFLTVIVTDRKIPVQRFAFCKRRNNVIPFGNLFDRIRRAIGKKYFFPVHTQ